jgi:hypothetical protein
VLVGAYEPFGSSKIAISEVVPSWSLAFDASFVAATLERHLESRVVIIDKPVFDHYERDLDHYIAV